MLLLSDSLLLVQASGVFVGGIESALAGTLTLPLPPVFSGGLGGLDTTEDVGTSIRPPTAGGPPPCRWERRSG